MRALLAAVAVTCASVSPVLAQQDSTLRAAVRMATEGQGDSARAIVDMMVRVTPETDSLYPEVLYTAGLLARDPETARAYFTIVGIEYSTSDWADHSLLRLAQLAFAAGNPSLARDRALRILDDYPFSETRGEAGYWAGRAEMALGNTGAGCELLGRARDEAGADVELSNRIAFYLQRCVALPTDPAGDSVPADTTRRAPQSFTVQVAALRSPGAVDQVMRSLSAAGYQSRVSHDPDGYLRVKVGSYRSRAEAQRIARAIAQAVGGEPFVVPEP